MATIYRKTAKGIEEIQTRQWRLVPRARSALIMVDGQRTDEDLARMVPGPVMETLQELLSGGFIETSMHTAAPAKAPAPAPAPAASGSPAATGGSGGDVPFERIRAEAVKRMLALVGPVGEDIAIRMERTKNIDALRPLVGQARELIAGMRGNQVAADYIAGLTSL